VIYFFQSPQSAAKMVNFLDGCRPKLDPRIRVCYIGADGRLNFIR